MHHEISVDVQAPANVLWRAVADVTRWPDWTPTIDEVVLLDGGLAVGARVRIRQPKLRTLVYRVDDWQDGSRFSWAAATSGVRIEAAHEVYPAAGGSRLRLTVDMTGPMAPMLAALVGRRTRRYADTEAAGLRRFAEQLAAGTDAA
jgi:uncharacterized membrane protein